MYAKIRINTRVHIHKESYIVLIVWLPSLPVRLSERTHSSTVHIPVHTWRTSARAYRCRRAPSTILAASLPVRSSLSVRLLCLRVQYVYYVLYSIIVESLWSRSRDSVYCARYRVVHEKIRDACLAGWKRRLRALADLFLFFFVFRCFLSIGVVSGYCWSEFHLHTRWIYHEIGRLETRADSK